jgi:hypothetical protein
LGFTHVGSNSISACSLKRFFWCQERPPSASTWLRADSKPSAGSSLKIVGDPDGYASLEAANKALKDSKDECNNVVGAGAEAKFKAAQAKAQRDGVETLTQKDIEGLTLEQIKQLRGY